MIAQGWRPVSNTAFIATGLPRRRLARCVSMYVCVYRGCDSHLEMKVATPVGMQHAMRPHGLGRGVRARACTPSGTCTHSRTSAVAGRAPDRPDKRIVPAACVPGSGEGNVCVGGRSRAVSQRSRNTNVAAALSACADSTHMPDRESRQR